MALNVAASCWPNCGTMGFDIAPPGLPLGVTASIPFALYCNGMTFQYPMTVTLAPDVPMGVIQFSLRGTTTSGVTCVAPVTLAVTGVNIVAAGISEADEASPGWGVFLSLNDDDDNGNGVPDKNEFGPIAGEDDLVPITLIPGIVGLQAVQLNATSADPYIRIFSSPDRSGPLTLPLVVPLADLPKTIYAEGINVSPTSRFTSLTLRQSPNGPCEDIVQVTVFSVQPVRIDATDPINATAQYHVDPHGLTLEAASLMVNGSGTLAYSLPTDFSMTFNQSFLITGENELLLHSTIRNATYTTRIVADQQVAHAPSSGTLSEIAVYTVPLDNDPPTVVPIPVLHSIFVGFDFICYSVPVQAGSKTIFLKDALVNIETTESAEIPTDIAAWHEILTVNNTSGQQFEGLMQDVTGPSLPPQGPNYRSKELTINDFFAPAQSLTIVGSIGIIVFSDGLTGTLYFSLPLLAINISVDLPLEANSSTPINCPNGRNRTCFLDN